MKLFRPVVDIDKKQIVQEQVLDEVVPVKTLTVGDGQTVQLIRRHTRDHHALTLKSPRTDQNAVELLVIIDLGESLIVFVEVFLIGKRERDHIRLFDPGGCIRSRQKLRVRRVDSKACAGDFLQAIQRALQNLICNHFHYPFSTFGAVTRLSYNIMHKNGREN